MRTMVLERGALFTVDGCAGQVIHVRAGRLWITQHGDYSDYVVEAGAIFAVRSRGMTLAGALSRSVVEVGPEIPEAQTFVSTPLTGDPKWPSLAASSS
jgi:hypothetical protein